MGETPAATRRSFPQLFGFGSLALIALTFGGCETAGGLRPPGRGIAEVADTDPKAASANIDSLSDVIRRNPSSPEAYNTRGVAYARIGRFSEAIDDFTHAIQLDPNNFAAYTNRALAYRQPGHNDLARVDFDRAISANPNHAPAYIGRPRTPRPFTRAALFIKSAATMCAP